MNNFIIIKDENKVIDTIHNFSQFFYNGKLITLFGEYHTHKNTCSKNNKITFSDYCYKELDSNSNCQLLLEYNISSSNPSKIDSVAIQEIFSKCTKFKERFIASDYRRDILTSQQQGDLYNNKKIIFFSQKKLHDFFIVPFFEKKDSFIESLINTKDTSSNIIHSRIQKISNYMKKKIFDPQNDDIPDNNQLKKNELIIKSLRQVYEELSDLKIISEISRSDDHNNEYIIIIGLIHFDFLYYFLNKIIEIDNNMGKLLVKTVSVDLNKLSTDIKNKNSIKCISLYSSFIWKDDITQEELHLKLLNS